MNIKDYLKQNTRSRRILVVSNVRRANALFRHIEKSETLCVNNTEVSTITGLAKSILDTVDSKKGFSACNKYIDFDEATIIFRGVALKERNESEQLIYFKNPSLFESFATAREVLGKINLIRSTMDLDAEEILNDNNMDGFSKDRFLDLFRLLLDYEATLAEGDGAGKKYLDNVAAEIEAYKVLEGEDAKDCLMRALGNCELTVLSEDKETLSDLQLRILERIGHLLGAEIQEVCTFNKQSVSAEDLDYLKGRVNFFKGYGAFNEAAYVANDIVEKKLPFGDVQIIYASDNQIQPISAMLKGHGIDVNFVSAVPSVSDPYISLSLRILDWASDRFSEKALCDVFAHPYLYYRVTKNVKDEDGNIVDEQGNALNGWYYFQHVLDEENAFVDKKVLGWGYERNREFINHVKNKLDKEREKTDLDTTRHNIIISKEAAIDVHTALLDIFDVSREAVSPACIFDNLIKFLENYSRQSEERKIPFSLLDSVNKLLKQDDRTFELNEAITQIKDAIDRLSNKEGEAPSCVTAERLSDWIVVNRPYLYVVGLSLKDLKASMIESPVMTDEEIEKYVKGYKPTTKQSEEQRKQSVYRTLALFEGASISLGYSSYDALAFFRSNPSPIYVELFGRLSDAKLDDLIEFTTGNPTEEICVDNSFEGKKEFEIKLPTSSSRMDTFLYCPRRYAYENVYNVPNNNFREYDSDQWLQANERGSFFHSLAEEYMQKMLIKPSSEKYADSEDEDLIREIAKSVHEHYKKEVPAAFPDMTDTETNIIVERACDYLYTLHQRLTEEQLGTRVLGVEVGFDDATLVIKDLYENEHKITYRGFIDRIDYYLDSDNKVVRLKLVDYKTGKRENQADKVNHEYTMQHVLYANAIETGNLRAKEGESKEKLSDYILRQVATLENDEKIKKWECKVDECSFHFPMDIEGKGALGGRLIGITELPQEPQNFRYSRLEQILSLLSKEKAYLDLYQIEELLGAEDMPEEESMYFMGFYKEPKSAKCQYCKYENMCPSRKVGVSQ